MIAKAAIISLLIEWDAEECQDVMVTFVGGDNPIDEAYDSIAGHFGRDFPQYEHHVIANVSAKEQRRAVISKALGVSMDVRVASGREPMLAKGDRVKLRHTGDMGTVVEMNQVQSGGDAMVSSYRVQWDDSELGTSGWLKQGELLVMKLL